MEKESTDKTITCWFERSKLNDAIYERIIDKLLWKVLGEYKVQINGNPSFITFIGRYGKSTNFTIERAVDIYDELRYQKLLCDKDAIAMIESYIIFCAKIMLEDIDPSKNENHFEE